jgi:glycosyltransferase involved in cell wall biosynthesis
MVDLTVAIPTYNSQHRLSDVLDKLQDCIAYCQQDGRESFTWEIIVVDNNSLDNTAKLVRDYQANWSSDYPLKYYFVPEQGAAFARQKAVEKAQGEIIAFLDDDNLPNSDWVYAAYSFGKEHRQVGAYGSQIHGYFFEQKSTDRLPDNFNKIACFLAIVERGDRPFCYQRQKKILPPAAGLVVRKQVWLDAVPPRLVLNHKGKEAGLASEDLEALIHIQQAGWEIWHNPAMVIRHKIANSRLQKEYLLSLVRCVGLSRHQLRMMTLKNWQKPLALAAYMAKDLYRLLSYICKHGSKIKTDTVAACQMEFLISSLKSPVFLWKKQYIDYLERKHKLQQTINISQELPQLILRNSK